MTDTELKAAPSDGFGVIARLSVLAMVVGLLAGAGASAYVAVQHHLTHFLWVGVPEALGLEAAPWWLVLTLPVVGGALTWGAMQLPGHGGHSPLDGLRLDIGPHQVASVLLAALASLSFGAVLGPEAPLVAIGTAVGAAVLRSPQHPARQVMMIVGAMAGAGAVLGNRWSPPSCCWNWRLSAGPRWPDPPSCCPRSWVWAVATSCRSAWAPGPAWEMSS